MKKLNLSAKIICGFAVVILMMVVIISIYQYALSNTSSGFEQVINSDVAILNKAAEIDALMQQARHYEKDFMLTKNLAAVDKHNKVLGSLIEAGNDIKRLQEANNNEESEQGVGKIISETQNYRQNFGQMVKAQKRAGLDSSSGQQKIFSEAAGQIAQTLIEHNADDLLLSLLQVRRTEMRYFMSDKDQDKDKYLKAINVFSESLTQSACDPVAKKNQTKLLKKYKRWLQEYFETDDTVYRDDIQDSMRELAMEIEMAINSIRVPNTKSLLLEIRKNEKDFLLSKDSKYIDQTHKAITNLMQAFEQANILPEHVESTREQLAAYKNAFDAMTTELIQMKMAQKTMTQSVDIIEPLVKQIYISSKERADNSTNDLLSNSGNMSKIALLAGFIALLLAVVVAIFLARSITAPIKKTVKGLTDGAEQVSAAASHISSASQALADGATNQAASLEQTSASMEELTSMTSQNADNADHANRLMKDVLGVIQSADASMGEMSNSMEEITKASKETSKIVRTIDDIAFQTNLLALNAAVEAARAGEAGAGFAVVADEVRNLALRAADAAKNTSGLIEGIVSRVTDGKNILSQTNTSFREVAQASEKVGSLVAEISNASKEQAQGLSQMNEAVALMDDVTQHNSASAEESAAASEELNSQANTMIGMVHGLRAVVEGGSGDAQTISAKSQPKDFSTASNPAQIDKPKELSKSPARKQESNAKAEDIIPMDDDDDFEDF